MKRFMYLSIGLLCLSLSALIGFHVGSRTAEAQPEMVSGTHQFRDNVWTVMLSNGDVYINNYHPILDKFEEPARYLGNFWNGDPVQTDQGTWGGVKGKYNDGD